MALHEFSYLFTVCGETGGLCQTQWLFVPKKTAPDTSLDDLKAAIRDAVAFHTKVLDKVFAEVVAGERKPTLTDTHWSVGSGYRYNGRLKETVMANLRQRLGAIFPEDTIDPRGTVSAYENLRAEIECTFVKAGNDLSDAKLNVRHNMNHVLNVCLFRFVQRLETVEINPEAAENIRKLEQTLGRTGARQDIDYFDIITARQGHED